VRAGVNVARDQLVNRPALNLDFEIHSILYPATSRAIVTIFDCEVEGNIRKEEISAKLLRG
jgi:hypothetical protein